MKLQGLSIIFALIVIPIILVLTYYISLQVETIKLQTSYDAKLLDATYDAMVAFELNTANEDLSSVADSLRSIIDASNNIFLNTLATNMGLSNASKSYLEPFIPAVLYTLYDGYYINSPTKVPEIAVDAKGVALEINSKADDPNKFSVPGLKYMSGEYRYDSEDMVYYSLSSVPEKDFGELLYKKKNGNYTTNINDSDISYTTEHVLKSYMPYSARYIVDSKDIVINYTLDNYLTIVYQEKEGSNDYINFTKSGYLIKPSLVQEAKIGSVDLLGYNENDAETKILDALNTSQEVSVKLKVEDDTVDPPVISEIDIKTNDIHSDEADAIIYYTKAKIFSDWVYTYLADLKESHIVENMSDDLIGTTEKAASDITYSFEGKNNKIFDGTQDPEKNNSTFLNHKYQVIRNSIQYNLNLAMSIYNEGSAEEHVFNMPVILEEEWEKIIDNISIVSFMQGVDCGLKTYNNYMIVSSTNNELTVIPEEIYFVKFEEFNNESGVYHRIDCPRLKEKLDAAADKKLTSFVSKEVKYDKIYDKNQTPSYIYDHKNLACYTCIVDGNYTPEVLDDDRKYAYYVALGEEKYNIYKMNSVKYSEGYDVDSGFSKSIDLSKVKQLEITFGHIPTTDFQETTVSISFDSLPGGNIFVLNTNQTKEQTITIPIPSDATGIINANDLKTIQNQSLVTTINIDDIKNAMKSVKITYK